MKQFELEYQQVEGFSKHYLSDKNLSLAAKGLLTMILKLQEESGYALDDGFFSGHVVNKAKILMLVRELDNHGYLISTKLFDIHGQPVMTAYMAQEYSLKNMN